MSQELNNMLTMIGCNKKTFQEVIKKAVGNISLSSGSYYNPYYLLDREGILAKFDSDGTLLFSR